MRRIFSVGLLFASLVAALSLTAQQPQCPTCPLYAVNAKYVNGAGPGYAPTAGAGLTLNLSAGRARCGSSMVNYAGGTLTLANNATNYVFLDTTNSCVPNSNTTGYTSSMIADSTVVTLSGAITTITDDRTFGITDKTAAGGAKTQISITDIAPVASDDGLILVVDPAQNIHLTRLACGVQGSTSVVVNMVKGGNSLVSDQTCTNGSVETVTTSTFANGSGQCGGTSTCAIAAHAPVTLHIGTVSGSPTALQVSVEYTVD